MLDSVDLDIHAGFVEARRLLLGELGSTRHGRRRARSRTPEELNT
ncbi:hypothetical protein [Parafrankia discariae]|nr:hypothetical protein [Parafrankia discariae]